MATSVKGFILAAGYGSRLHPLTTKIPKPLLPCMGVPNLRIAMHSLRCHDIQQIGINTHYLAKKFSQFLSASPHCALFHEPKKMLGSAGFVQNIRDWLGKDDLIVYNGDIVSDIDFSLLYRTHLESNAIATVTILPNDLSTVKNVLVKDNKVAKIGKITSADKGKSYSFACAQVFSSEFVRLIYEHGFTDIIEVYQHAIAKKKTIGTFLHRGLWFDIGTPRNFFLAHQMLHQRLWENPKFLGITSLLDEKLHISKDGAVVGSPHLARSCSIRPLTFIMSSHAIVDDYAQLDHCIVMGKATVGGQHSHKLILDNLTLGFQI